MMLAPGSAESGQHKFGRVLGAAPGKRDARTAMPVVMHDRDASAPLRFQPDPRPGGPQAHAVLEHRRLAQGRLDRSARRDDARRCVRVNFQAPVAAYLWIGILTASTYLLAGHMREQVCTYMCPWPRIQAALTDEWALNVTYRYDRGEKRTSVKKAAELRALGENVGDCIDCYQCVAVCPTGIDIRNGPQLECIQCGLCIDACDNVMKKIGREKRLIGYDNDINIHRRQEGKPPVYRIVRPRTIVYSAIIAIVGAIMLYTLLTRSLLDVNVLHDRNPVAVRLSDGSIRNAYTVRLLNKRGFDRVVTVDIEGPKNATVHIVGVDSVTPDRPMVVVGRDATAELRVLVTAPADDNPEKSIPVTFHITDIGLGEAASATDNFVAP